MYAFIRDSYTLIAKVSLYNAKDKHYNAKVTCLFAEDLHYNAKATRLFAKVCV